MATLVMKNCLVANYFRTTPKAANKKAYDKVTVLEDAGGMMTLSSAEVDFSKIPLKRPVDIEAEVRFVQYQGREFMTVTDMHVVNRKLDDK